MERAEDSQGDHIIHHLNTSGLIIRDTEGKGRGVFGVLSPGPTDVSYLTLLLSPAMEA
jgi:hypothetical protein